MNEDDIIRVDHRPPKNGFASGNYFCTCKKCDKSYLGDKRSSNCGDCAYKELDDTERLLLLAAVCSEVIVGDRTGWEYIEFEEFVQVVRDNLCQSVNIRNIVMNSNANKFIKYNKKPPSEELLNTPYGLCPDE